MIFNFTWKILSVDDINKTMVVEYTNTDTQAVDGLNIPQALLGTDVEKHISNYAPVIKWSQPSVAFETSEVGFTGNGTRDTGVVASNTDHEGIFDVPTAVTATSLDAAIQRVLTTISESTV